MPAFLLGLLLAAAAAAGPPREVPPGTALRWSAPGTTECFREGERFLPVGETCWYPIDLLTPAGALELGRVRDGKREITTVRVGQYPYPTQRLTVDDSKVHPSAADEKRIARETAEIEKVWARTTERRFTLPLSPPLKPLPTGGRFGARRFFNGEPRSPHSGADYKAKTGTPVLAAADGVVALAADQFFAGKAVYLDHGDGLFTVYFHLSRIDVEPGQAVKAGQKLGAVGATGRATGPHLHFGVRWRGARIDPAGLLKPASAPSLP
ncbi:MAG: M23 family metallopeptidase [Thermoanaerobaculia bacterium]|nr:M23 family metallopeptidase [Thermoanaerobaculia bacterium]